MIRFITRLALLFTITTAAAPALSQGLDLTVEGVRNGNGAVLILVFDNKPAFERLRIRKAVAFATVPARPGKVKHRFPDLDTGPYAIFLFHDENGDEVLNHKGNHLLEGVGATGAPNPKDDPSFAQASVSPGSVTVRIHYEE